MKFWQQKIHLFSEIGGKIPQCQWKSNPQPYSLGYQYSTIVLYCCASYFKFRYLSRGLIIDQIWRKRLISKIVPVFRKYLSVSRWNLPGDFRVSFRFPQVAEFGKSTANRRRSSWPILFVSITLVISMTGRSERSARALHDGADVVREAIGN